MTLFASGDSSTRANLHPAARKHCGSAKSRPTWRLQALPCWKRRASEFDVIHAHIAWLHLPLLSRPGVPFLTTMHGRVDLPGLPVLVRDFSGARFVSISRPREWQRITPSINSLCSRKALGSRMPRSRGGCTRSDTAMDARPIFDNSTPRYPSRQRAQQKAPRFIGSDQGNGGHPSARSRHRRRISKFRD
jgi:hypothetical protein